MVIHGNWSGLTTKPITDKSWEGIRKIFFQSFSEALASGVYPRKLIVRDLTLKTVKLAFDSSVALQIKVQEQGDTDVSALEARTALRMFAGRAAVSVLHCSPTFDTHHCRNGSWPAVLFPIMIFGPVKGTG